MMISQMMVGTAANAAQAAFPSAPTVEQKLEMQRIALLAHAASATPGPHMPPVPHGADCSAYPTLPMTGGALRPFGLPPGEPSPRASALLEDDEEDLAAMPPGNT